MHSRQGGHGFWCGSEREWSSIHENEMVGWGIFVDLDNGGLNDGN